ncbi:MAG: ABC-type transport auxiliary lipoprotein family protein [Candidatus Acidiferrales bacterium]
MQRQPRNDAKKHREKEQRVLSRRMQLSALLILAMLVAGCGAARPVKYYVLDMNPAPANTASAQIPVTLLVGRLVASQLYHDDRLVYGSGPVQLGTYEYDRWAEPAADMVQNMLVTILRRQGQFRAVSKVTSNVRGEYVVRGHLFAMYGEDQPELVARFTLQLELYDPSTRTMVWSQIYTHDEPVQGKTVPDIVIAMDKNVTAGLLQLSAGIEQYFVNHPPQQAQPGK